jgi:hypothetical protein
MNGAVRSKAKRRTCFEKIERKRRRIIREKSKLAPSRTESAARRFVFGFIVYATRN